GAVSLPGRRPLPPVPGRDPCSSPPWLPERPVGRSAFPHWPPPASAAVLSRPLRCRPQWHAWYGGRELPRRLALSAPSLCDLYAPLRCYAINIASVSATSAGFPPPPLSPGWRVLLTPPPFPFFPPPPPLT